MRRTGLCVLLFFLLVASAANFLASERPIVVSYQGQTYWLANVIEYPNLAGLSGDNLSVAMAEGDWALWAPVRFGPNTVRSGNVIEPLVAPSLSHPLGTDDRGRDVFARLVHGARASFALAATAALFTLFGGLVFGTLARGRADALIMGAADVASAVPGFLLVIVASGLAFAHSAVLAGALVAVPYVADATRLVRAAIADQRAMPYCEAARGLGISEPRLWRTYLLPAALRPLMIAAGLTAATAVLAEAGLSFLGFAAPPPTPSWGELLRQAAEHDLRWWLALPAGACVTALSAAIMATVSGQARASRRRIIPRSRPS